MFITMKLLVFTAYFLALALQRFADCHGMCVDNTWKYYYPTHSCFKLHQTPKGWTQSKEDCETIQGGHLATIRDIQTNFYVLNVVLTTNVRAWIGLHINSSDNSSQQWEWAGVPDKINKPSFTNSQITILEKWITQNEDVAYISKSGWEMGHKAWNFSFICEHESGSAVPEIEVTCPKSPAKVNKPSPYPITCRFLVKEWTYMRWRPLNRFSEIAEPELWSQNLTGSVQYIAETDPQDHINVTYLGNLRRRDDGEWKCVVKQRVFLPPMYDEIIASKSCRVNIYEPAHDLECKTQLTPDSLSVWCETKRIYPRGSCILWISRKRRNGNFQPRLQTAIDTYGHRPSTSNPSYFQSNCTKELMASQIQLSPGHLIMKVRMYPNAAGFNLSHNEEAFREFTQEYTIAVPEKPVFHLFNDTIKYSSLTLPANEIVEMRCLVRGGNPAVISTTVTCEFSLDESETTEVTQRGYSSTTIRFNASYDVMNDKSCSCWGDHITGKTRITTVTISVGSDDNRVGHSNNVLMIIAVSGGTFLFLVAVTIITVVCCLKSRRESRSKVRLVDASREEHAPEIFPVYANVHAKRQDKVNGSPLVVADGEAVLFLNDLYQSHTDVEEYVNVNDDETFSIDENQKEDLLYANTTSDSKCVPITGEDDEMAAADDKKGSAKQVRPNELTYTNVAFDDTPGGPDRKLKVISGVERVDYADISFDRTA